MTYTYLFQSALPCSIVFTEYSHILTWWSSREDLTVKPEGKKEVNSLVCRRVLLFLICLALLSWTEAPADTLDHWQWRSPLPQGNNLNSIAFGNNTIVAVGNAGSIITSSDGINWTVRPSPTSSDLTGIVYGKNVFVAVGSSGTIITSSDGISWTLQSSPTSLDISAGVAYGNNIFVASGGFFNGFITSTDGMTWSYNRLPDDAATTISISRITFSNNAFFAKGGRNCNAGWICINISATLVYSSPDGNTWTGPLNSSQYPSLAGDGYGVVYGNGVYLKLSVSSGLGDVLVSSDSVTWTPVFLPNYLGVSMYLGSLRVYFTNGRFYVLGGSGYIATSSDGVNWNLITSWPLQPIRKIVYGNGLWVAIGKNIIYSSTDGISWTQQYFTNDNSYDLTGLTYGNNTFVAVGVYNAVLTSSNGKTWSKTTGTALGDIAFGNGTFVGVSGNNLLTSPDGINWAVRASYPPIQYVGTRFTRIAFGNGIFAAIGYDSESVPRNDVVYTSTYGVSWTGYILNTPESFKGLNDICFGNNIFLIVGNIGYVFTSSDGTNWSGLQAGAPTLGGGIAYDDRYSVAYGDGTFVSVGEGNDILSSLDGVTWKRKNSIVSNALYYVAYVNHSFIVGSNSNDVLQSTRDDVPDPFTFTSQANVAPNTIVTSNTITVSGIDPISSISITGGTYSINGGAYTSAGGIVSNGDTVTVQLNSSGSNSTTTNATVTIGGVSSTFHVTNQDAPANSSIGGGGGGGCFIATAAFGSPMAGQVEILRQFRDGYLLTNALGQKFVAWYYCNAPVAASYIKDKPLAKMVVRAALYPLIGFSLLLISAICHC